MGQERTSGTGVLTMTMLARWAETSAYTPPEEPTTGAVMSATDTAKDPGAEREMENSRMLELLPTPSLRRWDAAASGLRLQRESSLFLPGSHITLELPEKFIYDRKDPLVQTFPFTTGKQSLKGRSDLSTVELQPRSSAWRPGLTGGYFRVLSNDKKTVAVLQKLPPLGGAMCQTPAKHSA